jgi:hypothetical protein
MQSTEVIKDRANPRGAGQMRSWRENARPVESLSIAGVAIGKALRRERALAGLPGYDPSRHLRLLRMDRERGELSRLEIAAPRPS